MSRLAIKLHSYRILQQILIQHGLGTLLNSFQVQLQHQPYLQHQLQHQSRPGKVYQTNILQRIAYVLLRQILQQSQLTLAQIPKLPSSVLHSLPHLSVHPDHSLHLLIQTAQ
ncbi:uncharacterized protein MELLADRAFT_87694 [Melampsora larici-populina 98AG31]|uniref:Uncharacterized protein n=1 Tax=Melampsora larici-populina (strain 98AG31 / pathotype 3-4-7) TaxID=747676 RepID=F4RPC5_MELLP|nr:uncharacterized protein MELLADRAFT_87694 [Melampsora larici-populina 98AG31]EGG05872.1 hypothetical protein MELLADRAFT_87694 [Melampsora larici-populina 98AG31]